MKKLIGNIVVGQSGGPTAAINATLAGVLRGARAAIEDGVAEKVYGMRYGVEGLLEGKLADVTPLAMSETELSILEQTPAAALGSCRRRLPDPQRDAETYEKLLSVFKAYNIRYFFYIGGNDSMDTVARLSKYLEGKDYEMRVVGVPKTIDNDLCGTDHTPGYGSAAKYVATTVSEILRDTAVYTVPAVTIVEIMGRDAGWLTAASALPGAVTGIGPDLVYLPEHPFDMEDFFKEVESAFKKHPNLVVCVSEGIRFKDGRYVGEGTQSGATDVFGHKYLSGTGKCLEIAVKERFGCKVRSVELNLPQRCAGHLLSLTDIKESVKIGKAAVGAAVKGNTGCMMAFIRKAGNYAVTTKALPVAQIANQVRHVPREYINKKGTHITEEGIAYIAPLVAGEYRTKFASGLPVHWIFEQ